MKAMGSEEYLGDNFVLAIYLITYCDNLACQLCRIWSQLRDIPLGGHVREH